MSRRGELASTYTRIGRTWWRWAPSLLLLAFAVFIPLGLLHTLTINADLDAFGFGAGAGFKLLAAIAAVLAIAATGLIGEVFYAGAVAISLTHPHEGRPPSLREIAGEISYGRLVAVDLIYGVTVAVGLAAFFIPGLLAFVWLGLAAPVIEIERQGIREALARSVRLVRGKFWLVALVLIPIEVVSGGLTEWIADLTHNLFAGELLSEWLADILANVAFTPFYAVACVLLTVDLIREKGGSVELHSEPSP